MLKFKIIFNGHYLLEKHKNTLKKYIIIKHDTCKKQKQQ